ncbi:MAG: hypothetical protein U9N49_08815, partial [Campylobacterota bacterium]|nr:hypothetical protein [Campylobacterota bacterium]
MKNFLLSFIALTMIAHSGTSKEMDRNILEKIKVFLVEPSYDNSFNHKSPIAFSRDRKRFVIGYDTIKRNKDGYNEHSFYKVLLYNPDAAKPTQILNFNKSLDNDFQIGGFTYSPDDKMIAIGKEDDITLIDASSGKVLQTLPTLPDNYQPRKIDTTALKYGVPYDQLPGMSPEGPPSNLHFTPDGTRLIG